MRFLSVRRHAELLPKPVRELELDHIVRAEVPRGNGILTVIANRHRGHEVLVAFRNDFAHNPHCVQSINRLS